MPAPGDLRRCLSALASDDSLIARSLEHRFEHGSLEGHPLGNLLLAGLAEAGGDFQHAITEVARLVGAVGTIYPATNEPVTLLATSDEGPIRGQVRIEESSNIRDLRFDPADPEAPAAALEAIHDADLIIVGPGSLFTSVLACVLVPGLLEALRATSAHRVFVTNVANDRAEAHGFDLAAHLATLDSYCVPIDVVLADGEPGSSPRSAASAPLVHARMAASDGWGHRPDLLGRALAAIHAELVSKSEIN